MRKKVSAMLEIVVCDDDIADLECAVTMLHKIFTTVRFKCCSVLCTITHSKL